MNKIGAVILARYSSNRLPGKALLEINNKKVLKYIIERLSKVIPKSNIIVATSDDVSDDVIDRFCSTEDIKCYRGSLEDVASRFYEAAVKNKWEYAIRINGDNIFVDTSILNDMIKITNSNKYDFVSNVRHRTFPKGMSIEIVRLNFYKTMLNEILKSNYYKEHVTIYLYENEDKVNHYYFLNKSVPRAAGIQLALDTEEDFDRTVKIVNQFKEPHWNYNLEEIVKIWGDLYNEKLF